MFKDTVVFASFSVDDLEKAKEFYGKTLGLDVEETWGMLQINNKDGSKIMAYPKPDHKPAGFTILNFPITDIKKTIGELKKAGIAMEQYDDEDNKTDADGIATYGTAKAAWFKDPAGNLLGLIEGM
jgi:predicted enzyme related to lactoylglutathione lyase